MVDTLIVAYEVTEEVKSTMENSLNIKYANFFAHRNESLTHTFNHFKCLFNDIIRFDCFKHDFVLF